MMFLLPASDIEAAPSWIPNASYILLLVTLGVAWDILPVFPLSCRLLFTVVGTEWVLFCGYGVRCFGIDAMGSLVGLAGLGSCRGSVR